MITSTPTDNNVNLEYLRSLFPTEGVKYNSLPLMLALKAQGIILGGLITRVGGRYLIFKYRAETQWWAVSVETLLDPNVKQWTLMSTDTDIQRLTSKHPLSPRLT